MSVDLNLDGYVRLHYEDIKYRDCASYANLDFVVHPSFLEMINDKTEPVNLIHIPNMGNAYGVVFAHLFSRLEKKFLWYKEINKEGKFRLHDSIHLCLVPYDSSIREKEELNKNYPTLIVDDAFVEGKTLKRVCKGLEELGFDLSHEKHFFATKVSLKQSESSVKEKAIYIITPVKKLYPKHTPKD